MSDFILVIFSAAVINNIVVLELLGADPALANLRQMDKAAGLSLTMCILLPVITTACYLLDVHILVPLQQEYLGLLLFVSVILLIIWCFRVWAQHSNNNHIRTMNTFLPFAGVNTTVLGAVLLNQNLANGAVLSFAYGAGTALGFSLVLLMLTAINERLEVCDVPGPFRGMPVLLLTLAIMSMAFSGFTGMVAG